MSWTSCPSFRTHAHKVRSLSVTTLRVVGPRHFIPRAKGGSHPHLRFRANGDLTQGSEFDGYADSCRILDFLAKPPNQAILDLQDPQNRTRDHDSIPQGPKISSWFILEPFGEDFLPNRAKSNPTNLGSGPRQMESGPRQMEPGRNLGMDFGFFCQVMTLDFEGSKKAPETSKSDS